MIAASRPRLDFLHGVRVLLALSVVLLHLTMAAPGVKGGGLSSILAIPLLHGYLAVPGFLVLSGFLLSVPVVLNGCQLPGGLQGFLWRRSVRIVPPYYAAYVLHLVFFVAWAWVIQRLGYGPYHSVDLELKQSYTLDNISSHLLLIHNFRGDWVVALGGVFWTIACEWQIYFLFAMVLVPLWRRVGLWAAVTLALVLGVVLTEGVVRGLWFYMIASMVPVFAFGMVAAAIVFGKGSRVRRLRGWRWGWISGCTLVAMLVVIGYLDSTVSQTALDQGFKAAYYHLHRYLQSLLDLLFGVWRSVTIVWLTLGHLKRHTGPSSKSNQIADWVLNGLESRPARFLGQIGYSLYLNHAMIVFSMGYIACNKLPVNWIQSLFIIGGGTMASVLFASIFYLVFERPSMARETRGMFRAKDPVT